uniref:BRCT domain-containing protein n=1 Tax=Phytophthora ramorum TaxID=164328 RepID=H3GBB1_PHYRM
MRAQWEGDLRVFLEEDSEYVHFLEIFEQDLVRKLRFKRRARDGPLVDSVAFDRFVETAAQLRYFHVLFQSKLKVVLKPQGSIEGKCSRFVEILADMLSALRALYGQLSYRSEVTQAALSSALEKADTEWDGTLLDKYLDEQKLTPEKLVARPSKRFGELVEFVEALSKTLSEDDGEETMNNNSDTGSGEKLNYAPQLIHIVQENKNYIHVAKTDAREEEELIALQTCFRGDGADIFSDLSNNKLLLDGEVFLSLLGAQNGSSGESATATDQETTFLESVPASVPVLDPLGETRALALIMRDSTFVFAWEDPTESVFWMPPDIGSDPNKGKWELVEIVFFARWLLVFKLHGWKGHSFLCQFDSSAPEMEIGEQPRGKKEWSLVISNGTADHLTLISKKRTRIDFWFDQVWKAVESAQLVARRVERENTERQEMEEEEVQTRSQGSKRGEQAGKKRKVSMVASAEQGSTEDVDEEKKRKTTSNASPTGSIGSKPDDKTDEECGELDKNSMRICVEEERATAPPATKKPRRSTAKSKQSTRTDADEEGSAFAVTASPALKTPKRRWLKRKSEDPYDTELVPTQLSPAGPTDESASEIDATQTPANNEVHAEGELKEVRIILTGVEPTASIRKKIDSIVGAVYEEDVERATHILAPKNQLKRTVKLLCAISCCSHVLDVRWLDESARVGAPTYERAHCLKDSKAEAKWHFDLVKTMYDFTSEQRRQLFAGHQVFITNHKSVLPPVKDLVKIVECAGGTAVIKGSAGPNDVVITSEAALATASVRKALTQASPQRIYSAELILISILQQHIDFDQNHLEQTGDGGSRRRR